jgi:hypothetical protein
VKPDTATTSPDALLQVNGTYTPGGDNNYPHDINSTGNDGVNPDWTSQCTVQSQVCHRSCAGLPLNLRGACYNTCDDAYQRCIAR